MSYKPVLKNLPSSSASQLELDEPADPDPDDEEIVDDPQPIDDLEDDDQPASLVLAATSVAPGQLRPADIRALQKEAKVEAEHEEAVDRQLQEAEAEAALASSTADAAAGEASAAPAAAGDVAADAGLAISPVTGELVGKPTEMDIDELKTHMADIAAQVTADVVQMEQKTANTGGAHNAIVIQAGKHDKLIRTLFGFTIHCKCLINDEVRMTVWILLIIGILCGIAFFIADVNIKSFDASALRLNERYLAITIGGVFSFLASVLSYIQIRAHHNHWVHPPSQRCVVRILAMVPVYSVTAWLSLVFLQYSLYIDFIRTCYEAFVIYTFMILLTKYLGGHNGVVEWMKTKPPQHWPSPLCCFPHVKPGNEFLYWLKYGTLQYTIISPIITIIAMVLNFFDLYGDGDVAWDHGYVYISVVQNCTQLTSLYCLVWLYVAMKNELAPFSPMAKFLVVKSVVFFTFWQSVGLAILVKASVIQSTADLDVGEIQVGLQDFIVCIEMFIAAAVHKYTFGWETYANGTMKLLMDERAMYLAQMSYKRAQEAQKLEEERLLKEERRKLGIEDEEDTDDPLLKKKQKKGKKGKKGKKAKKRRNANGDITIDISPDSHYPANLATPTLDPSRFTGDEDDGALVDGDALTVSQRAAAHEHFLTNLPSASSRRSVTNKQFLQSLQPTPSPASPSPSNTTFHTFKVPSASTPPRQSTGTRAGGSGVGTPPLLSDTAAAFSSSLSNMRRGSAQALGTLGSTVASTSKTLISSTKNIIGPVSRFFAGGDDDCLFDEDSAAGKPIMLTAEMRREIEEQARREKQQQLERRKSREEAQLQSERAGAEEEKKQESHPGEDHGEGTEMTSLSSPALISTKSTKKTTKRGYESVHVSDAEGDTEEDEAEEDEDELEDGDEDDKEQSGSVAVGAPVVDDHKSVRSRSDSNPFDDDEVDNPFNAV